MERDINRVFGTILELYFPKRAPKVYAPIRHTDWQQISEISSSKMHFRRFFDQYCACWVHILARALFTKEAPMVGVKNISIPASNSKNFKTYGPLKIASFREKWSCWARIVGKSIIFFPPTHFWGFRLNIQDIIFILV